VEVAEHIGILQREGELLAAAAQGASLEAAVPTCPGWTVRDLVRHVGGIHSWATAHISKTRTGNWDPFVEMDGNWPADAELIEWFRRGHAALVGALRTAAPDVECFTFLPAPSPLAFWARRQAHETGMHRVDAQGASGTITPFAPEQAVDGIDELLFGFMARPKQRLRAEQPRSLALQANDADARWLVRVSADEPSVSREAVAEADCCVTASASELFQLVWNRRFADGLEVSGDRSLLDVWRGSVLIRWR
jgi:uncharacterized protein (TIGR03083 family)